MNPDYARILNSKLAKENGTRPNVCELCGITVDEMRSRNPDRQRFIVGHHWRGYEFPLDVWWICHSCNSTLGSRHDGSLTKDQAKWYVRTNCYSEQEYEEHRSRMYRYVQMLNRMSGPELEAERLNPRRWEDV